VNTSAIYLNSSSLLISVRTMLWGKPWKNSPQKRDESHNGQIATGLYTCISMEWEQPHVRLPIISPSYVNRMSVLHELSRTYAVEDLYEDPIPPNDAWGRYLSMRFSRRPDFYRSLQNFDKDLIRKEVQRIDYFREYFKQRKLSSSDRIPLVASLELVRSIWRKESFARSESELASSETKLSTSASPTLERECCILRQVRRWETPEYASYQSLLSPENYIRDLELRVDGADDNPNVSNYGYNGWIIVFNKGGDGVSLDHPLCHGRFPNQKISIQQLLYNKEETPLKRTKNKNQLRYFHLPANSMKWVEVRFQFLFEECTVNWFRKQYHGTMARKNPNLMYTKR
jgi:hypothetical protein